MSIFFNRYTETASNSKFNGIVAQSNEAISYLIGELGTEGLLAFSTAEGNLLWSKSYSVQGETVTFIKGVQAPNGDFLLFGTTSKAIKKALIVRVKNTGDLIWAKTYDQGTQDVYLDMIEIGTDNYVFLTRFTSNNKEGLELVKIDANGRVIADYQLALDYNVKPMGLTHCDTGFMVYGTTDVSSNWDSFYIMFNDSLTVQWANYVGNSRNQVTSNLLHIGNDKFVATGEHGTSEDTFIYEFSAGLSTVTSNIFDLSHNHVDSGFKHLGIITGTPDKYLLVNQPSSIQPATFTVFNTSYVIQAHREITQQNPFQLKDLSMPSTGNEVVRCCGEYGTGSDALFLRTNKEIDLCCSVVITNPIEASKTYNVNTWVIEGTSPRRREATVAVVINNKTIEKEELCPNFIDLSGEYFAQSPFVYMQAAGSDGEDGTVKGFHLRWDFRRILSDKHIAKGNLSGSYGAYPATYDFNKADDFIKAYRTPFIQNYYSKIDLMNQPSMYNVGGAIREWIYENISPNGVQGATSVDAVISFPDTTAYDTQAASTPPSTSTREFLKAYIGEIDIRLGDKLCFRADWTMGYVNPSNLSNAKMRYESISLKDAMDTSSTYVSKRKTLIESDFANSVLTICEDIRTLRLDRVNAYPESLNLYAYDDYLIGTNQNNAWTKLGEYSLTDNQTEAYSRLEDSPTFDIDKKWPKFNEDDEVTGQAKVNVANYQDRWSKTNGLSEGVTKYLDLSQVSTNYEAIETINAEVIGNLQDNSSIEFSYFNMIGITGFDYHMGRMLGLGTIDPMSMAAEDDEYIYLMEYDTEGDLQDGQGARDVKHIYMTPHQNILDFKNSPTPILENPITYGAAVNNGTANPSTLTDANGYTPFADIRMVNLSRQAFQFEQAFESFFQNNNTFSLSDEGHLTGFGIEYSELGNSAVHPELNHDRNYNDDAGIAETNIIPNTGNNPVYRHQESENGIHCYSMYSVNWFSRASNTGASICTDETLFPTRNTIVPPANLSAHLIQPESPMLLTTSQEQIDYDALTGDKTYVRAMFDWNFIQNQQYQFADKIEFFFNDREKINTRGEIIGITQLSDHRIEIITASYDITSTSNIETIVPTIEPIYEDHFKESLLAVGGLNYRVEEIINTSGSSGINPKIILHQIKETNSIESSAGSNVWTTTENYVSPVIGERFFITENLSQGRNWLNKLQKTVYIERFSNNDSLSIASSTNNDGDYSIESVVLNGGNTDIVVNELINDSINDGDILIDQIHVSKGFTSTNDGFLIEGDVESNFIGITSLEIKGSIDNDGNHPILSVSLNAGGDTEVILTSAPNLTSFVASIVIKETIAVSDYDSSTKTITIVGDQTAKIAPTYSEIRQNTDGTTTKMVIGGISSTCTIVEEADVYNEDQVANGIGILGDPIPLSRTGVYTFTFVGNPLQSHIDPDVSWMRGKVRVLEDTSFLPTPLDSRTTAKMKELDVMNVDEVGGNLVLIVQDPTFQMNIDYSTVPDYTPAGEYVPIAVGSSEVNYHPSYHLYLKVDETPISGGGNNSFNEITTLPSFGEGTHRTFLGIRAVDTTVNNPLLDNCASHITTPIALLAQEIREPEQPNAPLGPLYATRPDFYGKSTYTIDIGFPNIPYSVLIYKANERKILDQLYLPETANLIEVALKGLGTDPYFNDRWNGLVNMDLETSGADINKFKEYGGYRFPNPDNEFYEIPQSVTTGNIVLPFDSNVTPPGDTTASMFFELDVYDLTMKDVVKEAIESAFVSQTEEPMIYEHLEDGTVQTSNAKPKFRNANGDRIKPSDPGYNAHPNAVKLTTGDIRFTDYNIDGGSIGHYFYYAMEYSDRQKKSPASTIVGPVQTVNTRPAKQPSIKSLITQIENVANNIPTAVCFNLEEYIESEGIVRINIYRAIDPLDALSIRTMDLAAEVDVVNTIADTEICDIFTGLDFPLYGEDLYYRVVAMRQVTLEDGITQEYIPSEPSKLVQTAIVDPNNPTAPPVISENGITTATKLNNVVLKWNQACYNGTYSLQKMNDSGNWVEVYKIKSNDDTMQYPPLVGGSSDFVNYPETSSLDREDANGTSIYHRFRIQVENSSGLFNLSDAPSTLATGDFDLQVLSEYISYTDNNGFTLSEIKSQEVDDGTNNNPFKMTFTANVPNALPAGHNAFNEIEVIVTDDQGNTDTKTITTVTGTAVFNDGDGGLLLDEANHSYTIQTKITTDLAINGFKTKSTLAYVQGPCNDLSNLVQLLTVEDSSHTYDLIGSSVVVNDSSLDAPVSLKFTDVSDVANLTNVQTNPSIEIILTDEFGNTFTKTISTAGGNVTFIDGEGGLVLNDGTTNRGYSVSAKITTTECAIGETFDYSINYNYDPYIELEVLSDVISYTDNNATINPLISGNIDNGIHNSGGTISITDLLGANLPTNHVFTSFEVDIYDGQGGFHTQSSNSAASTLAFLTGQGAAGVELDLGATNPNPTVSIEVRIFTDLCPNGARFTYSMSYTYDPYVDLASQTSIVDFLDGNNLAVTPLYVQDLEGKYLVFNDQVLPVLLTDVLIPGNTNPNGSIKITSAILGNLPAGDTFTQMDVTITDSNTGNHMLSILSETGNVIFNHGDGGLELNGGGVNNVYENMMFTFSIVIYTTLCPDGVTFFYSGRYSYGL